MRVDLPVQNPRVPLVTPGKSVCNRLAGLAGASRLCRSLLAPGLVGAEPVKATPADQLPSLHVQGLAWPSHGGWPN